MGVDFFPCDHCGESICGCGNYVRCNDECHRRWCDKHCAGADGYRRYGDDDEDDGPSCDFCRREDVTDHELLQFLLGRVGLTRERAVAECLKDNAGSDPA
jgi:hypothetical protein